MLRTAKRTWLRRGRGVCADANQTKKEQAMPPRILIAEDEEPLLELLRYNFEKAGYTVEALANGDHAGARLKEVVPDMAVLDWMLPGLSGIELCRRLRQSPATKRLPMIMLSARTDELDRLRGFEVGADDYVVKPFSVKELLARVAALLRRMNPRLVADKLTVGDVELNRSAMAVLRRGQTVHLGPTDYRLLEFFMQAPGRVFTRSQLLDGVWGDDVYIDERTIDVHIGRLRKALLQGWSVDPIRTVRGTGYSFEAQ
jgi:two-component system, OmpR family, phosphate regulon response regulator PhoB